MEKIIQLHNNGNGSNNSNNNNNETILIASSRERVTFMPTWPEKGVDGKSRTDRFIDKSKMDGERKNDLDYDPFASIDLMKMEEEVRSDQVRIQLKLSDL